MNHSGTKNPFFVVIYRVFLCPRNVFAYGGKNAGPPTAPVYPII